ncbi:MAG TPA: hypothetical protein VLK30_04100 [Candidatus Limnocylindrales bacterium]|nr:hypothetical protein [Candidatus Limnocylindrales bacterium]
MPTEFQTVFLASAGASAGLIGLLFVGVSIAPERVFGADADARRQAQAVSAFSALANVFFISMASLIPGINLGVVVTVIGAISSLQLLGLLLRVRPTGGNAVETARGVILFLASAAIFATEVYLGLVLWRKPLEPSAISGLLEAILGAYAIGLGRAWQLLGAPRSGLLSYALDLLERRLSKARRQ